MVKIPRFKDISYSTLDTCSIEAIKLWYGINPGQTGRREGFDRVHTMMADNRAEFAKLYGKRHQTLTTEFRFDVWRIEHEGLSFWLLTAKTKGSEIRMERPVIWEADTEQKIIRFLGDLYEELQLLAARAEEVNDELA
jgi:hypothetical protein